MTTSLVKRITYLREGQHSNGYQTVAAVNKSRMNGGSASSVKIKMRKNPVNIDIDRSVRDFFKRTNLDLAFIGLLFAVYSYHAQANEVATDAQHGGAVQQDLDNEVSSMMADASVHKRSHYNSHRHSSSFVSHFFQESLFTKYP